MKNADTYHTIYASSGLSIMQHKSDYSNLHAPDSFMGKNFDGIYPEDQISEKTCLLGGIERNLVRRINPVFNVRYDYVAKAKAYFREKDALAHKAKQDQE